MEIPRTDGQLGLTFQEIIDFGFVFQDPGFLQAMAKRGIDTPEELAKVLVTPLTPGSFGLPEERRRIVKAQMYNTAGAGINLFARPIEGVQAIVDLDDRKVLAVLDTGLVPVSAQTADFDEATVAARFGLRPALKPIRITQPQGKNFTIDGGFISWQKWKFHVRFERRAGTVISLVTYDGRSVLYQGALAEVFVPYQDPSTNWYYRTFMDVGEFGFGALSSPLKLGLDVPENAVLLDGLISAALPDPTVPVVPLPLPAVVGVFERVTGNPIWRHYEFLANGAVRGPRRGRAGGAHDRAGRQLRLSDRLGVHAARRDPGRRGADRHRHPQGRAEHDAERSHRGGRHRLRHAGGPADRGALPQPLLQLPARRGRGRTQQQLRARPTQDPQRAGQPAQERVGPRRGNAAREKDARLDEPDVWKVVSASRKNALGYPTGFVLESHGHANPLLKKADFRRAGFIEHALWVTAFDADERFASGDTPNQNPDEPGLPRYVADNESIVNRDIVLWHTVTFHHVTAAEDYPVLSREHGSFELKPHNFFDRNPALDLRRAPFEVP